MTIFRSEEVLMGIIALALIPWIVWTVRRGIRGGMLPIGPSYVLRMERPGAFNALLGFYVAAALLAGIVSLDLLLGLELRGGW